MPVSHRQSERCIDLPAVRVIFAGGGTGGHLFPAIAIAEALKKRRPDAEILFVGTKEKIEARVVPQHGYAFHPIWISGFRRSFRPGNLLVPIQLIVAMIQSFAIMKSYKPDVVVGTGGYVSGPILYAATMLGIPTLIQEQNSYPGETTRFLATRVDEVHLAFEKSRSFFSNLRNVFVTGNPVRTNLEQVHQHDALRHFGFEPSDAMKTILVFGGSLGAHSVNEALRASLEGLMRHTVRLIWQTGENDYTAATAAAQQYGGHRISVLPFIDRMDLAYAASDLIVCRAGATTIAEVTYLGKAAILIPYRHAAANHQVENALAVAERDAATVLFDDEVSGKLLETILQTLEESRLAVLRKESKRLGVADAADVLAGRVLKLGHAMDNSGT